MSVKRLVMIGLSLPWIAAAAAAQTRFDADRRNQQPPGWGTGPTAPAAPAIPTPVESGDLAPVMATDGSQMPYELWRGLDLGALEQLMNGLEIPPRSPALHELWTRLITSKVTPPSGDAASTRFAALRLEALYRSGLAAAETTNPTSGAGPATPLITILNARNALAANSPDAACEKLTSASLQGDIPARLKGQAILMTGYCAARSGNPAAAGLAAEIAREEGQSSSIGLAALDAIAVGAKARFTPSKNITLLDYRLAAQAGGLPTNDVLAHGEPALLVSLANDPETPADLGLAASEAATRLNGLSPDILAAIYRANAKPGAADRLLDAQAPASAERRAALFKAAETEQVRVNKLRLVQTFLSEMRREQLGFQAMQMVAPSVLSVPAQQELGWFAETAAEIGVVSGNYEMTRSWVQVASDPQLANADLDHWLALASIADIKSRDAGASLQAVERRALAGGFQSDVLHRLVTVLDALGYQVPIPLWNAASRTPQPASGYLPKTGVLSELQDAAKKREFGRTVLLAMTSLGPGGPEGAHMIALGDSIRALKRAGLEADARRVGLEALLAGWPRLATR